MNTLIDRLVITPMSWLLAVPIVLLDRLLSRSRLNCRAGTFVHCRSEMQSNANRAEMTASPSRQRHLNHALPTFRDDL